MAQSINSIRVEVIRCLATFFYSGLLPKMPGTWGSVLALPMAWYLWELPLWWGISVTTLTLALGIWAAHQYEINTGKSDNQQIVIDEAVGIFITAGFAQQNLPQYTAVFVLFRLFDIWKPFPIRYLDKKIPGGWGVMLDDVGAAVYAGLAIGLYNYYLIH